MTDFITERQTARTSEEAVTWVAQNILDPAVNAGPLGIYNTVADLAHLPECHLTVDQAKAYSPEWFLQGFSGGVGAAIPFMLAAAGTSKLFRGADGLLAGTKLGEIASPFLTCPRAAAIIGASAYGALQKPAENRTRLGNAAGMAIGFLAFNRGNAIGAQLPYWGKALVAYPAAGFVGGLAMSEGSQVFSNGKLASADQAIQSAVQGMTLNTIIPLAQEGIRPVAERASQGSALAASQKMADLSSLSKTYSDWLRDNQPHYPDPEEYSKLTPEQIVARGFYHPDGKNLDQVISFGAERPRPLPDADVVAAEVAKSLADMPGAKTDGDLVLGEWNTEFLNAEKANYFQKTYNEIVARHHIITIEEADQAALAKIAKDSGYNYAVSRENSRGQAVGFLLNPRLKILGTHSYDDVANVYHIPDLRPALRVDLQDTTSGEKFSAIAVHLKSMRGGPDFTAAVRRQQATLLAKDLEPGFKGYISGDWNTFLDKTDELNSLFKSGFKLLNPGDTTTTQSMGGRLDGFLVKNMPGTLSNPQVRPFFQNPLITRGLSDHALLSTSWKLPSAQQRVVSFTRKLF